MGRKSHKYGKNKRKIHTGGKSILHIRTSGAGYTKTAKRGRLGKNCVYFDLENVVPIKGVNHDKALA